MMGPFPVQGVAAVPSDICLTETDAKGTPAPMPYLALTPTLLILACAAGVFVWSNRQLRREPDPARPRMLPHVMIMAVAMLVVVMMLAHLVSLATGRPLTGRFGL